VNEKTPSQKGYGQTGALNWLKWDGDLAKCLMIHGASQSQGRNESMRAFILSTLIACVPMSVSAGPPDAFAPLQFLEGTWTARTNPKTGVGATVLGTYSFVRELDGHVLARHGKTASGCKGPESFDCDHGDLLYIYQDAADQPLKAIYFDSEGHVIHYELSFPSPTAVTFLSEPSPGPRFRLVYELDQAVMYGKFQVQPPGQTGWTSYLEWSGTR